MNITGKREHCLNGAKYLEKTTIRFTIEYIMVFHLKQQCLKLINCLEGVFQNENLQGNDPFKFLFLGLLALRLSGNRNRPRPSRDEPHSKDKSRISSHNPLYFVEVDSVLFRELLRAFSLYGLHKLSELRIHASKVRGDLVQVFASENIHNSLKLCIRITLALHWCEAVVLRVVLEQAAGH